jgi:hypothetical protein
MCRIHLSIDRGKGGLTCEEVLLGINEVIGGLVHLYLTVPGLGHVPYTGIAGNHMELRGHVKVIVFWMGCV